MSSSRPVPLWLVLLAIPYWGAVAWLTDVSPFQPGRRCETPATVVPAPPPPPSRCYYAGPNDLRCESGHYYRYYRLYKGEPRVGDFPARPRFRTLGLANGSYETQLLLARPHHEDLVDPFR
jgi:hypothetical protein